MWNIDFKEGKKAERILRSILLSKGISGVTYNDSEEIEQLKKYDLLYYNNNASIPVKIEVKADSRAEQTNNYAIECRYKDNLSGIETTESNYYAILKGNQFSIIRTNTLKELIDTNNYHCIEVKHANTFCYLIPCEEIESNSKRITVVKKVK